MPDTERSKRLVRRIIEDVINAGDLDAADEIFAPDYRINGGAGRGPDLMKRATALYRTAFPDVRVTVKDQLVDGDKVITRERWTGTHRAEFAGIAPTGRTVVGTAITIDRIVGGRIVERWSNGSHHDVLRQLSEGAK